MWRETLETGMLSSCAMAERLLEELSIFFRMATRSLTASARPSFTMSSCSSSFATLTVKFFCGVRMSLMIILPVSLFNYFGYFRESIS